MENTRFKIGHIPWNKKQPIKKVCPKCLKVFFVKPSLNRVVSCSRRCAHLGKTTSEKQKSIARANFLGNKFSVGRTPWNKGLKGFLSGSKHYNWKGGSSEAYRERRNGQYKQWRTSVFKRDNYTCQDCGISGVYVTAHHIKSFAYFPELRYDIENGKTLCESCHSITDNYKGRGNLNLKLQTI